MKKTYCGFVAIVGRANVGKSTLFNALLHEQLSVATHKPQTTRHNIRGILSIKSHQLILVDTPGVQLGNKRLLNKVLISNALSSLQEVDVILMVVELGHWNDDDQYLLKQVKQANKPVILVINKIDRIKDKSALLPILNDAKARYEFEEILPISALHDTNIDALMDILCKQLPESMFLFPEDTKWDRDDKFVVAEVVRGAAIMQLHKELPYAIYTEVENIVFSMIFFPNICSSLFRPCSPIAFNFEPFLPITIAFWLSFSTQITTLIEIKSSLKSIFSTSV